MSRFTTADYLAYLSRRAEAIAAGVPIPTSDQRECRGPGNLQDSIIEECRRRGWLVLHGDPSKRSRYTVGAPDLIVIGDNGKFWLVELKRPGQKLRPDQQAFAAHSSKLGIPVHVLHSLAEFLALVDARKETNV